MGHVISYGRHPPIHILTLHVILFGAQGLISAQTVKVLTTLLGQWCVTRQQEWLISIITSRSARGAHSSTGSWLAHIQSSSPCPVLFIGVVTAPPVDTVYFWHLDQKKLLALMLRHLKADYILKCFFSEFCSIVCIFRDLKLVSVEEYESFFHSLQLKCISLLHSSHKNFFNF